MTREQRLRKLERKTITFENLSYNDYKWLRYVCVNNICDSWLYRRLSGVLEIVKKYSFENSRDYDIFIERFNAYRVYTIHNDDEYLIREQLNYYWKSLDSKNRPIPMKKLKDYFQSSINIVEKFRDLPPYIKSLNKLV